MKKIRLIDAGILLAIVVALVVGYFTYTHFRQTAGNQIEKTAKISFQVFLRGVTLTSEINPIQAGDETFISIRNVPYTNLRVVDSRIDTKKVVISNPSGNPPFIVIDDYSQVFMYDVVVTIIDTAKITKDGAVVGGNKIKIGLPITLEGKNYKFNGSVSNVQILGDFPQGPMGFMNGLPEQPNFQPNGPAQPHQPGLRARVDGPMPMPRQVNGQPEPKHMMPVSGTQHPIKPMEPRPMPPFANPVPSGVK